MTEKVGRAQRESNKKLQEMAKRQTHPDKPTGPRFRDSPTGRRLAALRDKKMRE
jgi:hypothetical protein